MEEKKVFPLVQQYCMYAADHHSFPDVLRSVQTYGHTVHAYKLHPFMDELPVNQMRSLRALGVENIFVDDKVHDIPGVSAKKAQEYAYMGVDYLTVHVGDDGGLRLNKCAGRLRVLAVICLSSENVSNDEVKRRAKLASEFGAHGIIVSGRERLTMLSEMRKGDEIRSDLVLVVPGVRFREQDSDDHIHVLTPAEAIMLGADFLVVGSLLRNAVTPFEGLSRLNTAIEQGIKRRREDSNGS